MNETFMSTHPRQRVKTKIVWLVERGSPAEYASNLHDNLGITKDPWKALHFPTKKAAEEVLARSYYRYSDWRILDHMFYL